MMDAERKAEIRTRCDPSQRQPCRAYLEGQLIGEDS